MKIQCKQLERAGKKAEKEEQTYKKKAKEALKKNNEEGAKLYLMSAASKRN
jgi:charged multivesicular body protein 1